MHNLPEVLLAKIFTYLSRDTTTHIKDIIEEYTYFLEVIEKCKKNTN